MALEVKLIIAMLSEKKPPCYFPPRGEDERNGDVSIKAKTSYQSYVGNFIFPPRS
jgi:hypothetical protein